MMVRLESEVISHNLGIPYSLKYNKQENTILISIQIQNGSPYGIPSSITTNHISN